MKTADKKTIEMLVEKQIERLENELYENFYKACSDMEEYMSSQIWDVVYRIKTMFKEHVENIDKKNKIFTDIRKDLAIIKNCLAELTYND